MRIKNKKKRKSPIVALYPSCYFLFTFTHYKGKHIRHNAQQSWSGSKPLKPIELFQSLDACWTKHIFINRFVYIWLVWLGHFRLQNILITYRAMSSGLRVKQREREGKSKINHGSQVYQITCLQSHNSIQPVNKFEHTAQLLVDIFQCIVGSEVACIGNVAG